MIVFYLKKDGRCLLRIDDVPGALVIDGAKAYYRGNVVCNDLTVAGYAEYPAQTIEKVVYNEDLQEYVTVEKTVGELSTTATELPGVMERLAAVEDVVLNLTGV